MEKAKIKKIFTSLQGEGPYVGYQQLFIRFVGCNLACQYCDTNFDIKNSKEYSPEELIKIIETQQYIHSISLTGGEPLLHTQFLKELLPKTDKTIYLETNGTLYQQLEVLINDIDVISMDIKLNSVSNQGNLFLLHDKFLEIAKKYKKEIFAKIVFSSATTEEEIQKTVELCKNYDLELVMQPLMNKNSTFNTPDKIIEIYGKFLEQYQKTRLIPQMHKFLNIE